MNRSKNSIKNLIFSFLKYTISLLLVFVVRAVFVRKLEVEYLGINGLFSNILSVLSVLELGVGTSIVYSLYRVVAKDDKEQIGKLLYLYRKIYRVITLAVLLIGISLMPFLKFLVDMESIPEINLYIVYLIFLFDSALSYLSAHCRSLIFIYQRADIENKVSIIKSILLNGTQLVMLLLIPNYYIYILAMPLFTLIDSLLIKATSKKMFPSIKIVKGKIDKEILNEIKVNTKATLIHKIGGAVIYSTDNILISSLLGLSILGIYTNYYTIISALVTLMGLIATSIRSSVGNYIALETREKSKDLFNKITFIFMCITIFSTVCYFCIVNPFISIWIGANYVLPMHTALLISISLFLNISKNANNIFRDCCGLMDKDKNRVFYECIINIVLSIVLAKIIGLDGIILGTIISTIVGPLISEPFVVYKYYFKEKFLNYIVQYLKYVIVLIGVGGVIYFITSFIPSQGIAYLLLRMIVTTTLTFGLILLIFSKNKYLKECFSLLKRIVRREDNHSNKNTY